MSPVCPEGGITNHRLRWRGSGCNFVTRAEVERGLADRGQGGVTGGGQPRWGARPSA
jgi:hypothetical protein